jgi:hypothetical protein
MHSYRFGSERRPCEDEGEGLQTNPCPGAAQAEDYARTPGVGDRAGRLPIRLPARGRGAGRGRFLSLSEHRDESYPASHRIPVIGAPARLRACLPDAGQVCRHLGHLAPAESREYLMGTSPVFSWGGQLVG